MNSFTQWASKWKHDADHVFWRSPGDIFVWNAQTGYVSVNGQVAGLVYGLLNTQEFCWEILHNQLKALPLS